MRQNEIYSHNFYRIARSNCDIFKGMILSDDERM